MIKNILKTLTLLFALIFFGKNSVAQINEASELKTLFTNTDTLHSDYSKPLKNARNEIDVTISTGFLVYKTFVSSQDKPSCVFSPSCSEYAVEAFKKKGPIRGWFQTFDRLSRCHSFVKHTHYPFDQKKNRFYDPVN